jgi:hypothetical protein
MRGNSAFPAMPLETAVLKTLLVDPRGETSEYRARSLEDAVAQLIGGEYDTVILYNAAGRDELGLVEYLAGTWPSFLHSLVVKSVSPDGTYVWERRSGHFVRERAGRPRSRATAPTHRARTNRRSTHASQGSAPTLPADGPACADGGSHCDERAQ